MTPGDQLQIGQIKRVEPKVLQIDRAHFRRRSDVAFAEPRCRRQRREPVYAVWLIVDNPHDQGEGRVSAPFPDRFPLWVPTFWWVV